MKKVKWALARGAYLLGICHVVLWLQRLIYSRKHIRVIFYHDTPERVAGNLEAHMRFFKKHYAPVTQEELSDLISEGKWEKDKPGLLITFDDGLRSNYQTAVPIMERHGFKGWHFVPSRVAGLPSRSQVDFASNHSVRSEETYDDRRIFMNAWELRDLEERGHVVGCHTRTHRRLDDAAPPAIVEAEVVTAKRELEELVGHPVRHLTQVLRRYAALGETPTGSIAPSGRRSLLRHETEL